MSNALTSTNLVAHTKALEAAGIAIKLALGVPAPLKSIADQVIRSANSVPANLAEGHGRSGRDRLHFWRIAYASAKEVDSHLRLLAHARAVNADGAQTAVLLFDEVRAMTWRLLHPRSRALRRTMPYSLSADGGTSRLVDPFQDWTFRCTLSPEP